MTDSAERNLNVVASIITVANIIYAILDESLRIPVLPVNALPAKVILFLILESLFAYVFTNLIKNINEFKNFGFKTMSVIIIIMIYCLTSVFNVKWLIINNNWYWIIYYSSWVLCCAISSSIFALFITEKNIYLFEKNELGGIFLIHAIGFIVIFILLALDYSGFQPNEPAPDIF